jgi:hypothetical protein
MYASPPSRHLTSPPLQRGRGDLETLLSSPNCTDWVEISKMLLGPLPEGFEFVPKHKSNSYPTPAHTPAALDAAEVATTTNEPQAQAKEGAEAGEWTGDVE